MLAYVPCQFATYATVPYRLHWVLECLVGHADEAGRCWPSARTIAAIGAMISKSTVARHLSELVRLGHVSRARERRARGGWHYVYTVAARFLPANRPKSGVPTPARSVSHSRRTEEKTLKKKEGLPPRVVDSQWEPRIRAWAKSRFWLPQWGPRPDQPNCYISPALLSMESQCHTPRANCAARPS